MKPTDTTSPHGGPKEKHVQRTGFGWLSRSLADTAEPLQLLRVAAAPAAGEDTPPLGESLLVDFGGLAVRVSEITRWEHAVALGAALLVNLREHALPLAQGKAAEDLARINEALADLYRTFSWCDDWFADVRITWRHASLNYLALMLALEAAIELAMDSAAANDRQMLSWMLKEWRAGIAKVQAIPGWNIPPAEVTREGQANG